MIGRLTEDLCRPRLRSVGSGALGHRLCQAWGAAEPPCRPYSCRISTYGRTHHGRKTVLAPSSMPCALRYWQDLRDSRGCQEWPTLAALLSTESRPACAIADG